MKQLFLWPLYKSIMKRLPRGMPKQRFGSYGHVLEGRFADSKQLKPSQSAGLRFFWGHFENILQHCPYFTSLPGKMVLVPIKKPGSASN